jgi:CBS domain-containing protein
MHVCNYVSRFVTVDANREAIAAFQLMQDRGLRHIAVTDADDEVVGVLSQADAAAMVSRYHSALADVRDLMHTDLQRISESCSLADAAQQMLERGADVMIVTDGEGRAFGLLTAADLHRALLDRLYGSADIERVESSVGSAARAGIPSFANKVGKGAIF